MVKVNLQVKNTLITTEHGDLLNFSGEAIVCPVKKNLRLDIGVAHVIGKRVGSDVIKELEAKAPLTVDEIAYTSAGNLPFRNIFYAVVLSEEAIEREAISRTIPKILSLAEQLGLKSIAFPMLGSPETRVPYNTFGFLMLKATFEWLMQPVKLSEIAFILYNHEAAVAFKDQLYVLRQEYLI